MMVVVFQLHSFVAAQVQLLVFRLHNWSAASCRKARSRRRLPAELGLLSLLREVNESSSPLVDVLSNRPG
jgi:hypothetical protein